MHIRCIFIFILLLLVCVGTASATMFYTGDHFDTSGAGSDDPAGITVNATHILVTDSFNDEVYIFYINGTYTGSSWDTGASGNADPLGITHNDTHYFISDYVDDEVYVYTLNGVHVDSFDTATSGNSWPWGITIDNSYLWITDQNGAKVYEYSIDGTYTNTSWDTTGIGTPYPTGITIVDTNFLVADYQDAEVYQYYANGTYTGESWDTNTHGNSFPQGMDYNGTYIWIVDYTDAEVYKYYYNHIPSAPTLITSSNNSIETHSPITLDVSSTDVDGDPITYYYYGGTDPSSLSLIGYNDSVGGSSFNWSVYQYDEYYWNVRAYDGYEYSGYSDTYQFTAVIPPRNTTNTLTNGGFENWTAGPTQNPDGWTYGGAGGDVIQESTIIKGGNYSAEVIKNGVNAYITPTSINYEDYIGKTITVGFWVNSNVGSLGSVWIYDNVILTETHFDGNGEWQWISQTKTIDASATTLLLRLYNKIDGSMYFDDVVIVEGIDAAIEPYPANESIIYTTYPPLTYDVEFTWQDVAAPQYKLMVGEDENFNVLAVNTHVGTDNSVQSLLVNKQYWWKVYSYDGIYYSDSSAVYNFNLTGNSTLTGSAIEGVIYADINGVNTALSGAEVTIWNETWTDSAITGSNGYYLFTDVADGEVYNVQAKKDLYLDSSVALVNATTDPITQDFFLLPDRTSEEWRHYVKFVVWGPSGYYEGVTVTVYENSDVTALYTAETGNDGATTFIMDRQQKYRVTFIDIVQGIDREMVLYPKDDKYLIFVASTGSWSTYDEPVDDVIGIDVSTEIINSTHSYVNVSYTDTLSETTAAIVYLNQSNRSDPYNQTVIDSQPGYTNNWTHSFIVSDYEGESYYIHVVATHTTYGTIDQTYAVQFDDDIGLPGIPDKMWLYVAILIMMFTAGMFGASTATEGAAIICVEGWVFLFFGWFSSIDNNGIIAVGLGAATTIAIFANINKYSKKEGHE
ncbi:MAG: hypothetical protein KAQ85_00175 [Thermodesulfovibrionia bacterium]|nr:hypothetical protein [Thermodesulfovibrionia bacterium]